MSYYFITGANGGMGAAIRRALSQAGHQVIVIRPGAVRTAMFPAST